MQRRDASCQVTLQQGEENGIIAPRKLQQRSDLVIVTELEQMEQQAAVSLRLRKGLDFLRSLDPQALKPGTVEIDGREVYAMIQSYTSRPVTENPRFEAHRKYMDIQYLVSGTEAMGWAPLDQLEINVTYNAEKDVLLGTVPTEVRTLVPFSAGYAILLYPSDAHAPGLVASEPEPVVKVVVKVLLGD
jgi:YhcH/YjgK/YiaL family protein